MIMPSVPIIPTGTRRGVKSVVVHVTSQMGRGLSGRGKRPMWVLITWSSWTYLTTLPLTEPAREKGEGIRRVNTGRTVWFENAPVGSLAKSNQPRACFPSPTMRPQSLISPLTRQTCAPCAAISRTLTSGVSSGQKT